MRDQADRAILRAAQKIKAREKKAHAAARPAKVVPTAKGQREVRETDPGFLAYLRRQPCAAAGYGPCSGPIQAAHIRYSDAAHGRNPGMQRKNHDRHANPLCEGHHIHDQHQRSERGFWSCLGVDAYENAAAHFAAYLGAGR